MKEKHWERLRILKTHNSLTPLKDCPKAPELPLELTDFFPSS
jgi:hypothetical protein